MLVSILGEKPGASAPAPRNVLATLLRPIKKKLSQINGGEDSYSDIFK